MRTYRTHRWLTLAALATWSLPLMTRAETWVIAPEHPRLLIGRSDLPDLRTRCGIRNEGHDAATPKRFGRQRETHQRLVEVARRMMADRARPDDLFVPAVLHLTTGRLGRSDEYTEYVVNELLDPDRLRFGLDVIVALDYCWDAITPPLRERIVDRAARSLEPFRPTDSPLDHLTFQNKLHSLALALVLWDEGEAAARSSRAAEVRMVLAAAEKYLNGPFMRFCQQRGAMPTSGGNGMWEEQDAVLAVELWQSATGQSLWPRLADSLARSMEHYFYADTEYPGLDHGFVHDDGGDYPLNPGRVFREFLPAVPWVIARRTGNPVATWMAHRGLPGAMPTLMYVADRYQWVRLLYGPLVQPEAARAALPLGIHFKGGWVAMRSGWNPGATVLLFDAGQPFWRSRQHFDAGQFQIRRKGRLAIDSGDDVRFEAVRTKGGRASLNNREEDWDRYFQATIAHNCVTVADPRHPLLMHGNPWLALGNQRPIEWTYDLSAADVASTERYTGGLTAFETNSFYSYAAADLTPAYPPEIVRSMHRQILMIHAGAVFVLDRVDALRSTSIKTWHLQLPAAVRFDGKPLSACRQIHGVTSEAGIWEMEPDQQWLDTADGDGRLFVRTLLPTEATRRVLGGPMKPRTIAEGRYAGTTYFGGDPSGYEHRLWPASKLRSPNAVYTLGRPMQLGAQFGVGATWGRLDVSPAARARSVTFLHLLVPTDRTAARPPALEFEPQDDTAVVAFELGGQGVRVELDTAGPLAGRVRITDPGTGSVIYEKDLATTAE